MLVTLDNNTSLSAAGTVTSTYSPQSVQKVFVFFDDADSSNHWRDATITIQLGSKVLLNGASAWGLVGMSNLMSGYVATTGDALCIIDLGSHEIANSNDNLYVTVRGGVNAVTQVDVSAIVDEPGLGIPVRWTEYSDNTFTSNNCLMGIAFNSSHANIQEDASNCEVRSSINSSAPSFISSVSYYNSLRNGNFEESHYGLPCKNTVPLRTTFNYPSSATVDRILTVEQDTVTRAQARAGKDSQRVANQFAGK